MELLRGDELMRFGARPRPVRKRSKLRREQEKRMFFRARLSQQEEPGNVHAFDVTTRDENDLIIGGARLLALVEE